MLYELGYGRRGFAPVATDAGKVAVEYGVTREKQDEWAVASHQKWFQAYGEGKFRIGEELLRLELPQKKGDPVVLEKDESPRENVSLEKMATLKTIYGNPTITAGNAPGMNSGASAVVLMSRQKAEALGLKPLATIEAVQAAAGQPYSRIHTTRAMEKLLDRVGLTIDQMDLIEINEASRR